MESTVPHTGPYDADFDDPRFDPVPVGDSGPYPPDRDERQMGMLAHLAGFGGLVIPFGSIVAPLAIYLAKRDSSEFVEDQARESLNFQISMVLAAIASAVLMVVLIGFLLLPAVLVYWAVGTIMGALKANEGEWYRYKYSLRLIKG